MRYIQPSVVLLSTVAVPAVVAQLGAAFSDNLWAAVNAALTQMH